MDSKNLILTAILIIALLTILMAIYLQIYKRNINRALKAIGKKPMRMVPPYKMLNVMLSLLAITVLSYVITFIPSLHRVSTEYEIEQNVRNSQAINSEWNVDVAMTDNLAAVLSYPDNMSDHTFSVFINKHETFVNYVFSYGGSSTLIAQSIRIFEYDGTLALLSMNELHITKIECHNGEVYEVDPNRPFVIVIPNSGFDAYDVSGNSIDLGQEWWDQKTDIE